MDFSEKLISLPSEQTRSPKKIIVVGAGLSGLTAAYHLKESGHDVAIFEARERAGGRVHTLRKPFSSGMYAEAGAARIRNDHKWTLGYVRHFGLSLHPFYPDWGIVIDYRGSKRSLIKLRHGSSPYGIHMAVSGVNELGPSGGISSSLVGKWKNLFNRLQMSRIAGGMDQLVEAFAGRLRSTISFGSTVTGINQDEKCVNITVSTADNVKEYRAEYLVCAIPLTTLRQINITPRLSEAKQTIFRDLKYQSGCRYYVQVSKRIWKGDGLNGFAHCDKLGEIWDATHDFTGEGGILVNYFLDEAAKRFEKMDEGMQRECVVENLEKIFPGVGGYVERVHSFSWDSEKWSLGARAQVWDMPVFPVPEIIRPEGRISFAGEHASHGRSLGWMDGALESGNRIARMINALT